MNSNHKQTIRNEVRKRYAGIAKASDTAGHKGASTSGPALMDHTMGTFPADSCCGPLKMQAGRETSTSRCCTPSDVSPQQLSAIMGYTDADMKTAPAGANLGLGCGNPVALASLQPGETVLDLGSGGGFDCFLAAKAVGRAGKVIGVDMTPDMIDKARNNAEKVGADNVEFRLGEIEHLPVADNSVDIIMSNCVINLSPEKRHVYQDAFRVLKPGGRLAISDVLATAELPEKIRNDLALVGACIGGAATIETTRALLENAGFEDIRIESNDHSRELIHEWDPLKSQKATDYVLSAYIQAVKPG